MANDEKTDEQKAIEATRERRKQVNEAAQKARAGRRDEPDTAESESESGTG